MSQPEGRPPSKAQRIRDLAGQRKSIAEIQEVMRSEGRPVSYQHVHNTLSYSKQLQNPEEAAKARKAMVHHRDDGPRSLEERELLTEKREGIKQRQLRPVVETLLNILRNAEEEDEREESTG